MADDSGGHPFGDEGIKLPTPGIRPDVIQAASKFWPQFRRRAGLVLGSQKRAAKLMEAAALSLSRQLDGKKEKKPPLKKTVVSLLKAHLASVVPQPKRSPKKKLAPRTKDQHAGGTNACDFAALFTKLDDLTSMIVAMRSWGHDWKEIGSMLGVTSSNARSLFLRSMRTVLPKRTDKRQPDGRKGSTGNKKGSRRK